MDQSSQIDVVSQNEMSETHQNEENYSRTKTQEQPLNDIADCESDRNSTVISGQQSRTETQDSTNVGEHSPIESTTYSRVVANECLFIPPHAVVDDNKLKFILHPNLNLESGLSSTLSLLSCGKVLKSLNSPRRTDTRLQKSRQSLLVTAASSDEQHVERTAKEILYDIAKGKWTHKNIVIDEENDGTKKFGSKSCSNANCVKAQERERRQRAQLASPNGMNMESVTVFEDGSLPSYHSLLNLWKYQEDQQQRYTWLQEVFSHGFPRSETEFLKMWRECRKNPEAFGIKNSEPKELPNIEEIRQGSRVRKVMKPYDKRLLVAKDMEKRPPVCLASTEYYQPDWKPVKDFREREKQKNKYEKLRKLYPHLSALRDIDYKVNPGLVKRRLKQAEEWHRLVTASNKPCPLTKSLNTGFE